MSSKKVSKQIIPLLREAVNACAANPVILIPFITLAFVQLLALEILYFFPRFPLSVFLNPVVQTLWGGEFVHYPNNFLILPKLFQNVQVFIYIFVSGYMISIAIELISAVNKDERCSFITASGLAARQYVHIFIGALIVFCTFLGLHKLYYYAAAKVLSSSLVGSAFFAFKSIVFNGGPYLNILIGTFVAALYAFVFPAIMISKKKIFSALVHNFQQLWGSFWFIFLVILVPSLFYVPVLILRNNIGPIAESMFPEIRAIAMVIGVIVTMFIDATVYTAITTFYLLKKEHK